MMQIANLQPKYSEQGEFSEGSLRTPRVDTILVDARILELFEPPLLLSNNYKILKYAVTGENEEQMTENPLRAVYLLDRESVEIFFLCDPRKKMFLISSELIEDFFRESENRQALTDEFFAIISK